MGFENILDGSVAFLRQLKIGINVSQGIDDCRFTVAFYEIRCLTKTARIDLLNEHKKPLVAKVRPLQLKER
jgi:hypothetical protein